MRKVELEKQRFIIKMNGILLALDMKEKLPFISEVILNLALYGGKDCFEGLDIVDVALTEVKRIIDSTDFKKIIKEEHKIPKAA